MLLFSFKKSSSPLQQRVFWKTDPADLSSDQKELPVDDLQ